MRFVSFNNIYNFNTIILFQALLVHKPAGINKNFNVALVSDQLSEQLGKPVLAGSVWKKLKEMFDLKAVEDREEFIPFSLEVSSMFLCIFCLIFYVFLWIWEDKMIRIIIKLMRDPHQCFF